MKALAYSLSFVVGAVVAYGATALAARLARRLKVLDMPGLRKVHTLPTPCVGGVGILAAVVLGLLAAVWVSPSLRETFAREAGALTAMAVGAAFIWCIGLVDDIMGLSAKTKLVAQILAACVLCHWGARIETLSLGGGTGIQLGALSWPVTVFWILLVTNAVNLADGLDGLAAGICAVACAVTAVCAVSLGSVAMAVVMLATSGAACGFLPHNRYPARVFLGDCGALLTGFLLGGASVFCFRSSGNEAALALPALALGVPIIDTGLSVLRRLVERRSIFASDRQHIHHHLLELDKDHGLAVGKILRLTEAVSAMGLLMLLVTPGKVPAVFGCVAVMLVVLLRSIMRVNLLAAWRRLWRYFRINRQSQEQRNVFERCRLRIRESRNFRQWWRAVCESAEEFGLRRLVLRVHNRGGTKRRMVWDSLLQKPDRDNFIRFQAQVRHRTPGRPLDLVAEMPLRDSFEESAHRATLFGRLIDEHSIEGLEGGLGVGWQDPDDESAECLELKRRSA